MKQYINSAEVKSTKYKKYAALLESYRNAVDMCGYRHLLDCYGSPSGAKCVAEKRILNEMVERNGYGYAVTSYNTMFFSCAYLFPHPGDGNLILCYETTYHTYYIDAAGL